MPEVRIEEEGRPNRIMIGWGDFDLWAMRNNRMWHQITTLACHYQIPDEERLRLLAYHLLKQNEELLARLMEITLRNPPSLIVPDPSKSIP